MSTDQTLARIDATLEDYDQWDGDSPDAARWDGDDWIDERKPGQVTVNRQRAIVGGFEPPQHVSVTITADTRSFIEAMERMAELANLHMTEWQRIVAQAMFAFGDIKRQAEAETGKSWAYLAQRAQRPYSAAERTSSPRRRAGSRRTKRQTRRRG